MLARSRLSGYVYFISQMALILTIANLIVDIESMRAIFFENRLSYLFVLPFYYHIK